MKEQTTPTGGRAEETILTWAFEHSSDGMLITDLKGVITTVNTAFIEMFGYSRQEVIGKRTSLLRSRFSTQEFYEEMWRSLSTRGEWKGEIINRTKSGKEKTCFLTITSIISPEGDKLGFLGVEIDLTERRRLEAQIIQGEKLASIGESLATLMHEIRNPINGISMNIYMLKDSAMKQEYWSEEERESIQLISKEVKRLEGLIKDALAYARKIEIRPHPMHVAEFFDELKELTIYQAMEQDVELLFATEPETLLGSFDPDLMKQVLLNLVRNAIEAAAQSDTRVVRLTGRIDEGAEWRYLSPSGKVLLFIVENSGKRIPEEVRSSLFKPFFTTKEQGLGLGLATSAKIVRQHHGIIDHAHTDEVPFSTVFTVVLPI
ncbi:MAG: PAS domain S-box protein [Bacteroidota bacterium]|nr:PAS domain S-box protein [Bacteroidota bacterium]MDP4230975.1 PAS domain S-box protein [Bacteroidota bacterium]MDP4235281.1 PAS domain S-box protein [Bacteroidota bacterium]